MLTLEEKNPLERNSNPDQQITGQHIRRHAGHALRNHARCCLTLAWGKPVLWPLTYPVPRNILLSVNKSISCRTKGFTSLKIFYWRVCFITFVFILVSLRLYSTLFNYDCIQPCFITFVFNLVSLRLYSTLFHYVCIQPCFITFVFILVSLHLFVFIFLSWHLYSYLFHYIRIYPPHIHSWPSYP